MKYKWWTIQLSYQVGPSRVIELVGPVELKDLLIEALNRERIKATIECESEEEFDDYTIELTSWNIHTDEETDKETRDLIDNDS